MLMDSIYFNDVIEHGFLETFTQTRDLFIKQNGKRIIN